MMDSFKNILLAIFFISLAILIRFGLKKFIFCLFSLIFGYIAARYVNRSNFGSWSERRRKQQKNSLLNAYSAQEMKHVKNLKRTSLMQHSSSNSIKLSSSSSSISSMTKANATAAAASTMSNSASVQPPRSTIGSGSATNTPEFPLEFYLKRNYPWHSVYLPPNVDKSIEELLSPVIQEYILSWYSKISKDDGLILEMKILFRHILANLIKRGKQVDLNYLLTYKLNTLLYNHISDFVQAYKSNASIFGGTIDKLKKLTNKERVDKQFELFKMIVQSNCDSHVHFALTSRRNEIAYLRKLCTQLLPFLLPDSVIKCRAAYELVQEITVSNLLLPMLDVIARPESINKLITNMLSDSESILTNKKADPTLDTCRIQFLKHWTQMNGCIFKSIQTPSFNDLIENNEHLCIFISYLNTFNSLSILQFYLMIKDILKTYNEAAAASGTGGNGGGEEDVSSNSPNVSSQIEELKAWCKNNRSTLEAIVFDYQTSYYDKLKSIVTADTIDHELTKTSLQKVHQELYNLIKDTYYTSFLKSDFIYKNLYGLKRLNSSPTNKSPITQRKGGDNNLLTPTTTANYGKESFIDGSFSLSNNDMEIDDYEFKVATNAIDSVDGLDTVPMSSKSGDLTTSGSTAAGTTVGGENDEDEDETDLAEIDVDNLSLGSQSASARLNTDVRLDLINEINDEFMEEDMLIVGNNKPPVPPSGSNLHHLSSLEDEDDDERKMYMSGMERLEGRSDEDGDDDDDDGDNNVSSFNLGNLRVSIEGVDEVLSNEGGSSSTNRNTGGYVFVIRVWNLDPKLVLKSGGGETPNWFVRRKYDEFYVLDARLRQFHGGGLLTTTTTTTNASGSKSMSQQQMTARNQLTSATSAVNVAQLPPKPRAILSFSNKENNLEYLESIQNDFERYIQSLLTNPILGKSKLIKSFLDPNHAELNSSLLNNITNLGKMVKGVPYKLRFERGQSLDSFLSFLYKTIRQVKPKPSQSSVSFDDITDKQLSQSEFANPEKSRTILKKINSSTSCNVAENDNDECEENIVLPFESFMFLISNIYKLPHLLCLVLFTLRKIISRPFEWLVCWFIRRKVNELTTPEAIEQFILLLKETLFGKDPPATHNFYNTAYETINAFATKNKLYALAKKLNLVDETLESFIDNGTTLFLETFQYPILNKNLIYKIFDTLMAELFPELEELNNTTHK